MKVLITGGTGFIGSRLALKCLERGDSVRVLGQENNSAESENRRLIESRGFSVRKNPGAMQRSLATTTGVALVLTRVRDLISSRLSGSALMGRQWVYFHCVRLVQPCQDYTYTRVIIEN